MVGRACQLSLVPFCVKIIAPYVETDSLLMNLDGALLDREQ